MGRAGGDRAAAEKKLAELKRGAAALNECRNAQDLALGAVADAALRGWAERVLGATRALVGKIRGFADSYDDGLAAVEAAKEALAHAAAAQKRHDSLLASASAYGASFPSTPRSPMQPRHSRH